MDGGRKARVRTAALSAAIVGGLLAIGGLGYAATYVPHVISVITHSTVFSKKTTGVHVFVHESAARAQYGTTTTTTTATTTTTTATTTTTTATTTTTTASTTTTSSTTTTTGSGGEATTSGTSGQSGSVSTAAPGSSETVAVTWAATTFSAPVTITVDPTPAAQPGFTLQGANNSLVSISVTNTSTGTAVTALAAPLEIVFDNVPATYVPSVSSDGVNFRALSLASGGTTLGADQQDGYFVSGTSVHVLTRHLTYFGVLNKANISISETGRKLAPAGSGKFGDPTLVHTGPAVLRIVKAPTLKGRTVRFTFSVDEQTAVYLSVLSRNVNDTLGTLTLRGSKVSSSPAPSKHAVVLRPGTIATTVTLVAGPANAPFKLLLTAVDYDGHKTTKTVTIGR